MRCSPVADGRWRLHIARFRDSLRIAETIPPMKPTHSPLPTALVFAMSFAAIAFGHDIGGDPHPHYDFSVKPPGADGAPVWFLAQASATQSRGQAGEPVARTDKPAQAAAFEAFAPRVNVRLDERFLFVESNGMPAHNM